MLIAGICELTLETRDIETMEHFYCGILECSVLAREDDRVWLACGERTRLGLWTPGEKEFGDEGGRHVHFAFAAARDQLDRVAERLQREGVDHRGPVEHDGGDRSVYVEDPMGNVVEVWDFFEDREPGAQRVDELAA